MAMCTLHIYKAMGGILQSVSKSQNGLTTNFLFSSKQTYRPLNFANLVKLLCITTYIHLIG